MRRNWKVVFLLLCSFFILTQKQYFDQYVSERKNKITYESNENGNEIGVNIWKSERTVNLNKMHQNTSRTELHINNFVGRPELSDFIIRQSIMRNTIDSYCNKNTHLPVFEKGFSSIILDSVDKLTYCPIYKVASSSWAVTLLNLRGKWKINRNSIRSMMMKMFVKVDHRDGPKRTQSTTKFMIIRHPFQRIISAYRDKFENGNKYYFYNILGENMVQLFRPLPQGLSHQKSRELLEEVKSLLKRGKTMTLPDNSYANPFGPTFEEFIKYIISSQPDDDHWRPYYIQCSLCYMQYDFILRFENLSSDSNLFIDYLNKSDVISPRWENPTSKGATTEDLVCEYFGSINMELRMKLIEKYDHDFKMFDYSPEKYINCIMR